MWKKTRLLLLLLPLCLFSPGYATVTAAEYTVTEEQLASLEQVFSELRSEQETQQTLLTGQKAQIETLKNQLKTSDAEMKKSAKALKEADQRLKEANQSLAKYADSAKRTKQRLERQRDLWAILATITVGAAVARR